MRRKKKKKRRPCGGYEQKLWASGIVDQGDNASWLTQGQGDSTLAQPARMWVVIGRRRGERNVTRIKPERLI